jgi:hypothetical protein
MQTTPYPVILKRAGIVLVVVGLLDICALIYSIVNRTPYSSNLSVFAVIGGVFLLRGSLRAASLVQWFALFIAAAELGSSQVRAARAAAAGQKTFASQTRSAMATTNSVIPANAMPGRCFISMSIRPMG